MIRCAAFVPTRGSSDSCAASAVLMLTTPSAAPEVAGVSAAKAAAPAVAMRNAMTKMGRDFRMVLFLLSFVGSLFFGWIDWLVDHTRTFDLDPLHFTQSRFCRLPPPFRGRAHFNRAAMWHRERSC